MSMCICAGPGDKIRFTNVDGVGTESELDSAFEHLTLDKIYTIARVVVQDSTTSVWVFSKGSEGRIVGPFNTEFFEDVLIDEERAAARSHYINTHENGYWDTQSKRGYGEL